MDKLALSDIDPKKNAEFFKRKFKAEIDAATVIPLIKGGEMEDIQLIDVRDEDSFEKGHVKGAMSMPLEELGKKMSNLDKGKGCLVYCYDTPCMLSARAARMLSSKGFKCKDVIGGFEDFEKKGAPIEKGKAKKALEAGVSS